MSATVSVTTGRRSFKTIWRAKPFLSGWVGSSCGSVEAFSSETKSGHCALFSNVSMSSELLQNLDLMSKGQARLPILSPNASFAGQKNCGQSGVQIRLQRVSAKFFEDSGAAHQSGPPVLDAQEVATQLNRTATTRFAAVEIIKKKTIHNRAAVFITPCGIVSLPASLWFDNSVGELSLTLLRAEDSSGQNSELVRLSRLA